MIPRPPRSTLFPDTTLFRSRIERSGGAGFAAAAILEDDRQKTVHSAVVLANSLPRAKLVVFTRRGAMANYVSRSEEHTSELQSRQYLVCRLLLEKKNTHIHN